MQCNSPSYATHSRSRRASSGLGPDSSSSSYSSTSSISSCTRDTRLNDPSWGRATCSSSHPVLRVETPRELVVLLVRLGSVADEVGPDDGAPVRMDDLGWAGKR